MDTTENSIPTPPVLSSNLTLTLKGEDHSGPDLSGAEFTLTRGSNTWNLTTDANGSIVLPWGNTDTVGATTAESIVAFPAGSEYTLTQLTTTDGYVRPGASWTLKVGADHIITAVPGSVSGTDRARQFASFSGAFEIYNDIEPTYTYDANGGTFPPGFVMSDTVDFSNDETSHSYELRPSTGITHPEGKAFMGWNTKADGSGTMYGAGKTITVARISDSDDTVTLYAVYTSAIARVSSDGGSTWTYHDYLIDSATEIVSGTSQKKGAFDQANTLTGSVIIELLRKGDADGTGANDDTRFQGDTVGRYTLTGGFVFNNAGLNITLRTTQDSFWNPSGSTGTIRRGSSFDSPMLTLDNATLRTESVIFDGANISTSAYGSVIRVSSGSLTIAGDTTIRNAVSESENNGGAICCSYTPVVFTTEVGETILFENCKTKKEDKEGGAIETTGGQLTINNKGTLRAAGCSASFGGFICTDTNGEIVINNSGSIEVSGCSATSKNGGAIFTGIFKAENNSGSISITNCTAPKGNGGAIVANRSAESTDTFVLTNTETGTASFTNCSANDGGAVYVTKGQIKIVSKNTASPVTFVSCSSTDNGGAICHKEGKQLTLTNVSFGISGDESSGCTAKIEGGACYSKDADGVMTDCSFYYCKATSGSSRGGAISHNAVNKDLKLYGCVFDHCETKGSGSAKGNGGAIYNEVKNFIVDERVDESGSRRSSFTNCTATRYGGAIEFEYNGGRFDLSNTDFDSCTASGIDGGAVASDALELNISNCTFKNCTAPKGNGGGLCSGLDSFSGNNNTIVSLENSTFDSCSAKLGAAVYYKYGSIMNVSQSGTGTFEIKNCTASDTNGGAVNVGEGRSIRFEGDVVIYNNFGTGALAARQKNVVLQYKYDSDYNKTINTKGSGLGANAHIGVYVAGESSDPYKNHGQCKQPFGTALSGTETGLEGFTNDIDETLFGVNASELGKSGNLIYWVRYICKIKDQNAEGGERVGDSSPYEHPFITLNKALTYARTMLDGKATIEMLVDYVMPGRNDDNFDADNDRMVLGKAEYTVHDGSTKAIADDITLTTAATSGVVYRFTPIFTAADGRKSSDSAEKAILQRGWQPEKALFIVQNPEAKFTTQNIILDGYSRVGNETVATQKEGRAFYLNNAGGTLTIGDGTIIRRFCSQNGSAVQVAAEGSVGGLIIKNATIQDCYAIEPYGRGGAIFLNKNAKATETGMHIIGHTAGGLDPGIPNASKSGGAIYLRDNASFTFNRGIIENCTAGNNGGGICADAGAIVTFNGGEIENCTAGENGGGIYADGTVTMKEDGAVTTDFERGTIENCSAKQGGGIYIAKGTLDMDGGAVENCSATQDGGAIYVATGTFKMENDLTHPGMINNCHADGNGGAIYVSFSAETTRVTITGGTIQDCRAGSYGGAIYDDTKDRLTIKGVTIDGHVNLAASTKNAVDGGAIYMARGTIEVGGPNDADKVTIQNCTVSGLGAAIKDGTANGTHAEVYFINSSITNCAADDSDGGAVNVGQASKIYFEGDTVIYNNPSSALGVQHKNVVLDLDTANEGNNGVINTTEKGLGSKAKIGIYVVGSADDPQTEPYKSHGQAGQPFGVWSKTWTVGGSDTIGEPPAPVTESTTGAAQAGKNNLSKFVNDRNDLTGTLGTGDNADYIVWQITVKLYEGEVFHDFKDCLHPAISQDSAYTVRFQADGTKLTTVQADMPTLKFTKQVTTNNGGTPQITYPDATLPVGTRIIMRINDGEYYHTKLASAASSVAFTEFKKMGDGSASAFSTGSVTITNGSYTAQFIIDFSGVAGGMPLDDADTILKLYTGLAYGSAEPDHNHNAEIDLLPKAVFSLAESTGDNDLSETVNVKTGVVKDTQHQNDPWYLKPAVMLGSEYGRASIWDNRDMALVLKAHKKDPSDQNDKDTVLPADAKLKVSIGGVEKPDCAQISAGGNVMYIIPLDGPEFDTVAEMNAGRNVQLDLASEHFPSSDADYKFDAKLMVANSDHELSPLNGMYDAEAGKAAASGTVIFKHVGGTTDPSLKIKSTINNAAAGTQDTHCYGPEQDVAFTVSELNVPDGCEVVAEMFKKNNSTGSWAAQSANKLTSVAANPAAGDFANPLTIKAAANAVPAGKEWRFYFTTEAQAANAAMDDSYKLVVKVVRPAVADDPSTPENEEKAAETLREVPYYFLVVGK